MSSSLWSKAGVKRLELGRGGGESRKLEYAIIGGLGVIIVGSIVFAVYSLTGESSPRGKKAKDMHLECTKCGHQFTKPVGELYQDSSEAMKFEDMGILQLDCPSPQCGAKKSCLAMLKCPKCEKHYLGESTKQQAALMNMPPPRSKAEEKKQRMRKVRDICPDCGQDRLEWYRKKYPRTKK